jgi:hypothetical protein
MKDNELYYLAHGAGTWHGRFSFAVRDALGLLGTAASPGDKASALLLHGAMWALGDATINSRIKGTRGARLAKSEASVQVATIPILRLPPVRIYVLRGYYRMDDDGRRVGVRMHEEFGPIPLLFSRDVKATAEIGPDGMSARYQIPMFGSPWVGAYTIAPEKDHVDVVYTCPWGELRYESDREDGAPPLAPPPGSVVGGVIAIVRELQDRAERFRASGDPMLPFTDLYADITAAIADAIDGQGDASGRPPLHDPEWVAHLAHTFSGRFLAALDARARRGHVPDWWRPVFDALAVRHMTELDAAALCIYAHVAGDLPHALVDAGALAGDAAVVEKRLADYAVLSEVLAARIDDAANELSDLYSRFYALLQRLGGRTSDVLVARELRALRAVAWYDGSRLAAGDPVTRRAAEEDILASVEGFVSDLLDPPSRPVALLLQCARNLYQASRRW